MSVEVRPATACDVVAFYGRPHERTMRAWVVTLDGNVVALGGIAYKRAQPCYLFAEVKPEGRHLRKSLVKAARRVLAQIKGPLPAQADPALPLTEKLLQRLGFESLDATDVGALYLWRGGSR